MPTQLSNHVLAWNYVSLNDSWRRYIELGLFKDKIEFEYEWVKYWIWPFRIFIPEISKDPEWREQVKTWVTLKYVEIINNYDLMFTINKAIYVYLKQFIKYEEDNALPQYEDQ